AAQDLAAGQVEAAPAERRLWFGRIVPVELRLEELGEGDGRLDLRRVIPWAGFDERHPNARVLAETRCQHAPSRAGTHDDVVIFSPDGAVGCGLGLCRLLSRRMVTAHEDDLLFFGNCRTPREGVAGCPRRSAAASPASAGLASRSACRMAAAR